MTAIIKQNDIKREKPIKGPQKGAVTHHQDQSIVLVNLKIIKTIPKIPNNPIPPLDVLFVVDIIILFLFEYFFNLIFTRW